MKLIVLWIDNHCCKLVFFLLLQTSVRILLGRMSFVPPSLQFKFDLTGKNFDPNMPAGNMDGQTYF